ncbi:hypothetical protein OIU78_025599 [Salix suchowensis]|nr:hypothetical protein OIU78_025599 [Salix suchowensis]
MEGFQIFSCLKGSLGHQFLLFIVWSSSFQVAVALQTPLEPNHVSSTSELGTPPISGLFGPIEISPSVLPRYPYPGENLAPMYPTFPTTYEPNLTGKCPVNFTAMSNVIDRTASDCSQPLAALVGNVICCPQLGSLLHIFQGYFSGNSDKLVLQNAVADDCFSDIISILASRGANITIPTLCSVKSLNLTGGLCPVKDVVNFEKIVNTSKLLEACSTVDPLKECCRPICQSAIMEAALEISGTQLTINDYKDSVTVPNHNDPLSDCKGVVFSYISRKLSADAASSAFRIVSACKVNKVCPLNFTQPLEVIKACRNVAAPNPSCCSSLNTYIAGIQNQMLITNKQAIICATVLGSKLRQGGVMTNVYELCDIDLKDFSIQEYGKKQSQAIANQIRPLIAIAFAFLEEIKALAVCKYIINMAATLITRKDHHRPMEVPNLHNPVLDSQKRSRTSYMEQQQQGGDYYHRNQLGLQAKNPRVDRFNNNGVVNYGPQIQSLPQLEGKKVELNYGVSGFHARVQAWKPELSNNGGLAPKFQALPQLQDQKAGGNNRVFMPNLQAWKPQNNNFVVSRPYPPLSRQFQGMKPGFYNGVSVSNYQVSQHFQDNSLKVDIGVFNPNHPAMQQFQEKKSEVNMVNNNGGFTPNPPVMQLNLVNLSATNMPLNSQAQVASGYSDLLTTSLVGDGLISLAKHEVQSNNANSCKFNCAPKLLETSNQLVANECSGLKNSLMNSLIKKEDDFRGVVFDSILVC